MKKRISGPEAVNYLLTRFAKGSQKETARPNLSKDPEEWEKNAIFEIDTLQNGSFRDTYIFNDYQSLLNNLEKLKVVSSLNILEIRKNGKPISMG